MERQYVSSSNIASIGYDPDNQVLEIEFLSGAVYQYYDVPQSVYDGLMAADSHGKFLDVYIKNRHKAQRKAKFYINKCRSASCMQGGLKQASA